MRNKNKYILIFLIAFLTDCIQCLYADMRNETVKAIMLLCTKLCRKIEGDCYFDCGRHINTRSLILDSLWLWCTNECDMKFQLCIDELKKINGQE